MGNDMAIGITADTFEENSYLTVQEYKNAPTSMNISALVVGGNQAAQDAELESAILRASSYMNEYLNQNLVATQYTETQRIRYSASGGYYALHPYNAPIISLSQFYYGANPNQLNELEDCSLAWFEGQQIIIPGDYIGWNFTSQGPLQFGGSINQSNWTFTKYTYVAGYVNTVLSANAAIGATQIVVDNATGIIPGQRYRISDAHNNEYVHVSDNYTYGNLTVTLQSPLVFAHLAGATFYNLPNALKQACILITSALLKMRGDSSTTMQYTTSPSGNIAGSTRYGSEIQVALDMVNKYRRIR
jgi:hypothetical protein